MAAALVGMTRTRANAVGMATVRASTTRTTITVSVIAATAVLHAIRRHHRLQSTALERGVTGMDAVPRVAAAHSLERTLSPSMPAMGDQTAQVRTAIRSHNHVDLRHAHRIPSLDRSQLQSRYQYAKPQYSWVFLCKGR